MPRSVLGEHISQQFHAELEEVRKKVLRMGGLVEEQVVKAVGALVSGDSAQAREAVESDKRINLLELEIDEECTQIVARRQPAASDLRLVLTVIKMVNDLERIGDESKRVGKMVQDELRGAISEEMRQEVEHMGELVRRMLRQVLDAFARSDVDTAVWVVRADHKVDIKYQSITRQMMTYMAEDPRSIPDSLRVLWAARSMERMGDRCQNIAEYIIYLVHGKDVRHASFEEVLAEIEAEKRQAGDSTEADREPRDGQREEDNTPPVA